MCMRGIRETEQQLGLENVPPVEALVRLVRWSVRYHATHADYNTRHLHGELCSAAKWLKSSGELKPLNRTALSILEDDFTARPAAGRLSGGARRSRCPPVNQQLQLLSGVELLHLQQPVS